MRKTRMQKGITLIALIITIIILLILAVVTIGSIKNSEIVTYAQESAKVYKEAAQKEEILLDLQFKTDANGEMFSGDNIDKIVDASKDTQIASNKLTTYYDLKYKRSFVVYRYDLVTEEERTKLEESGIKMLKGDVDLDGDIDNDDLILISKVCNCEVSLSDKQKVIAEMNDIDGIDVLDLSYLNSVISGAELYGNWMKYEISKKLDIAEEKLVEYYDECTEKYYVLYRYDLVTAEERTKLEENGIKMLKGDLNFDGVIDNNDYEILFAYVSDTGDLTDKQKVVAEINNQGAIDVSDSTHFNKIINNITPLYEEWKK